MTENPTHHPESGILSCMLQDAGTAAILAAAIPLDWFVTEPAQILFTLLCDQVARNQPTGDLVLLSRALHDRGQLNKVGGPAYLAEMRNFAPNPVHYPHYQNLLREEWARRQLRAQARQMERLADDRQRPAHELLDEASTKLASLTDTFVAPSHGARPIREALLTVTSELQARFDRRQNGQLAGISTGIPSLDIILSGLQGGRVYAFGARPKMGKSALVGQISSYAAKACPVLEHNLEMTDTQLAERKLVNYGRLNAGELASGNIPARHFPRILQAAKELSQLPIYLDFQSATAHQIAANARRAKRQLNIGLLVVDYIQRVKSHDARADLRAKVAHASNVFADLAVELNIPVIVVAQLNREAEGVPADKLHMGMLKEAGDIEQDAAFVGLLGMEDPSRFNDTEVLRKLQLHIVANRFGSSGELIDLDFHPHELRFQQAKDAA